MYNNNKSPEESKRISWLSIYSSLLISHPNCTTEQEKSLSSLAYTRANELFEKYQDSPFPSIGDGASLHERECTTCGKMFIPKFDWAKECFTCYKKKPKA